MTVFAVPPPFSTWGGWVIFGMLLLNFLTTCGLAVMLWRSRLDGKNFLSGAHDLLTWAKDARNSVEHRAASAVGVAVREMKQEAAKVVEAAEAVKTVAGAVAPTPVPPAKETPSP